MKKFYFSKVLLILLVLPGFAFLGFAGKIDSVRIKYDRSQLVLPG